MTKGQKSKDAVYKRHDGKCFYCGKPLGWSESTIDHFIPKSWLDEENSKKAKLMRNNNLVLCCPDTNWFFGNMHPLQKIKLTLNRGPRYKADLCKAVKKYNGARKEAETAKAELEEVFGPL